MFTTLTYPSAGRGAWRALGGTLNAAGTAPGPYYRAPSARVAMPGLAAFKAIKSGLPVDVNDYAVYRAIWALQSTLGASTDGLYGQDTAGVVADWQRDTGLEADGVFGPTSAKLLWRGQTSTWLTVSSVNDPVVTRMVMGHIQWESGWDAGAVGVSTPQDLGLGQINGPAHSTLSAEFRLTPRSAIPWVAGLVMDNLTAMGNERDAIAAYNLGISGARRWVAAGRPQMFANADVWRYIDQVQKAQA